MKLSEHFTLAEMTRSQTASRRGIGNDPSEAEIAALGAWCKHIGEPVRKHFRKPVIVTSGFRSKRLNAMIGGSSTSQHCKGEAVDFHVPGKSNLEICEWISGALAFDQLIYEFGEAGWIHCSWCEVRARRSVLTAARRGGRVTYMRGLVT